MTITLPSNINADGLLPFICVLDQDDGTEEIKLDFAGLRRVSPAALVVLAAFVDKWKREGRVVTPLHLKECPILGYLQRMDVLATCGFSLPETFTRHDAQGRFVPLRAIDHRVMEMGNEMALCVAPGGNDWEHPLASPYDLVWYVVTEMANNVRQHSGGRGFAAAQVGQSEGMVRLAIADNGHGILQSFRDAGFSWSANLDDAQAIIKALEPKVSSKGSPNNEGVGLTLTSKMAELAEAWMLIVSGCGVVYLNPKKPKTIRVQTLPENHRYPGTLVALTFRQNKVQDFASLLDQAKHQSGLLHSKQGKTIFLE